MGDATQPVQASRVALRPPRIRLFDREAPLGYLLMRHLLPAPSFKHAFQNVVTPGTEEQVLGPYLPRGTYMGQQQFEAKGCPPGF